MKCEKKKGKFGEKNLRFEGPSLSPRVLYWLGSMILELDPTRSQFVGSFFVEHELPLRTIVELFK